MFPRKGLQGRRLHIREIGHQRVHIDLLGDWSRRKLGPLSITKSGLMPPTLLIPYNGRESLYTPSSVIDPLMNIGYRNAPRVGKAFPQILDDHVPLGTVSANG
jgi:hypothetical protein